MELDNHPEYKQDLKDMSIKMINLERYKLNKPLLIDYDNNFMYYDDESKLMLTSDNPVQNLEDMSLTSLKYRMIGIFLILLGIFLIFT